MEAGCERFVVNDGCRSWKRMNIQDDGKLEKGRHTEGLVVDVVASDADLVPYDGARDGALEIGDVKAKACLDGA